MTHDQNGDTTRRVPASGMTATRPARPPALPQGDGGTVLPGRRAKGNWRKTLFRVHGWIGLNLGLLLFVICFSGTVATLSHEIDWLLDPNVRAPARDAPYDWPALLETVDRAFPEGHNLGVYAPLEPGFAAVAYVELPSGQLRKVHLDPHTGALQGHTSFFNAQRFFRDFHRRFFDGERGIVLVTLWGFVLLAAALSGFVFYRGWLKQLFTLRRGKGPRLLWSDLHKTSGLWALIFTLLIALTGVFYFVELVFQAADRYDALLPPPLPEVEEAALDALGPHPEPLSHAALLEAAQEAYPALEIRSIRPPLGPGDPFYVDGQAGNVLTRDRADRVHVQPFTGEVLGVQRTSDLGVVPFLTDAVDPLHFGYLGGLWTKGLWFALGLVLSFSILAGTYLWIVRTVPAGVSAQRARRLSPWLRGASVSLALTLAYFVVATLATVRGVQDYRPSHGPLTEVARAEVGPYAVRVGCAAPCVGDEALYHAQFLDAGLPNYQEVQLKAASAEDEVPLKGRARGPSALLTVRPGEELLLRVTARDGASHLATFEAPVQATTYVEERAWPETAPGVWWVVGLFVALVVACTGGWLYFVVRALQRALAAVPFPATAP